MQLVRTGAELNAVMDEIGSGRGLGGVLVPTMGALHEAHVGLIRKAREIAGQAIAGQAISGQGFVRRENESAGCVVSIFVNPAQFNERDDFERYPRPLDDDLAICEREGVAIVFVPEMDLVYPRNGSLDVPDLPPIATAPRLEDAARPGHFQGVCQVLHRLFELLGPAAAVFGEKDYQQLILAQHIGRLRGVEVVGLETVREPDGLAMSSRNVFLEGTLREQATALSRSLVAANRETSPERAEAAMVEVLVAAGLTPDYAVVRDAKTLTRQGADVERYRAVVAARVGVVRLLDNAPWPGWSPQWS